MTKIFSSIRSLLEKVFFTSPKNEMKPNKVVVGLGNPGSKYKDTRHNIGFTTLAEVGSRYALGRPVARFHAECLEAVIGGQNVLLLCPTTYMNLSGTAVAEVVRFYKLDPKTDLLVVCDDLDLPLAKIRVRESGGSGGQKGLKDIIAKLGSQDFARLRIGIGRPSSTSQVVDFVLTTFRSDEREEIGEAVKTAVDAVAFWVEKGTSETMNRFNFNGKKNGNNAEK